MSRSRSSSWGLGSLVVAIACGDPPASADGDTGSSSEGSDTTVSSTSPSTTASTGVTTTASTTTPADDSGSSDDAGTSDSGDETGTVDCADLPGSIDAAGLHAHLEALAAIATKHGGNRSVGTPGYDASRDYVRAELEAAGYTVALDEFDINVFSIGGPSSVSWQGEQSYAEGSDFNVASYSAPGMVSDTAYAVDVQLGLGNGSTSGCEPGDFAGFPAGSIAVLQRGACVLAQKVQNAQAAGATGALVFNQGDDPSRMDAFQATLGALTPVSIPVVFSSYAIGAAMAQASAGSVTVAMDVDVTLEMRPTASLVVETGSGDPDDVIMFGAHLDSVPAGPGINDNGSGSAVLLELARAVGSCTTTRRVRFAWWAAEEVGLVGSQVYVDGLDAMQRAAITAYLNFDMVASPNWVRFRYDGDGSAYGQMGPMGSAELEQVFTDWFDGQGLATEEAPFDGRSDYGPFIAAGIASGGLATGAEGIKSPAQAEAHGGQAGQPYDACYHGACDGLDNVDMEVLTAMAGAAAHVVELYAM